MVIMNYTLLNVFLAIAVDGLADFEVISINKLEENKKEIILATKIIMINFVSSTI